MLDHEFHIPSDSCASVISVICPKLESRRDEKETTRSLDELTELLRTLGIATLDRCVQNRKTLEAGTILGTGKLESIAEMARQKGINLLVFDLELTAGQIKNIKDITQMAVVDRCHVILEIFAKHAQTREAKIQIEISRLKYVLPRLAGFWGHFSRQKGGIGIRGGEGEQQIELDRRLVRKRIEHYKEELKRIVKSRIQQRKKRQKTASLTAALVGYTNAGKSSLMNRLCRVNVIEEDKLFATLDTTYRTLNPDTRPKMILIDTVGFISNLPNTLVEGFKTTLESAIEADLLLIVCDISDPYYQKHLEVTQQLLIELNIANKEQFIIFNKKDRLKDPVKAKIIKRSYPNSFLVSSLDEQDMKDLRDYLIEFFLQKQKHYDLFIPYQEGPLHASITSKANIIASHNHETGIFYRIRVPDFIFNTLNIQRYILGPESPLPEEIKKFHFDNKELLQPPSKSQQFPNR